VEGVPVRVKRLERPGYEDDRAGAVGRWDERETLFARADLFRHYDEGSPERAQYYRDHPGHREYDEMISGLPHYGGRGGVFGPVGSGLFGLTRVLAGEDVVEPPVRERGDGGSVSPEDLTRGIRALAVALGADLVGIGPLREEWVYSHSGRSFGGAEGLPEWGAPIDLSSHETAIALGFRMDADFMSAAPEYPTYLATASAYALGAVASVKLARHIARLGHSARAHHVYNYGVIAVPVAVDCGLGELSRAGFLMTREFGLGVRIGVVTTDLPLVHDAPVDIGVQSFCERCEICADHCPSGAIPRGEKTEHNGIRKWKLDEESCYRYWHVVSTDCAVCMSTCPWTKPDTWLHRALTRVAMIGGPHQRAMVAAEKLFYGRPGRSGRGESTGLDSLRPTNVRPKMRALGAAVAILAAAGLWWAGAAQSGPATAISWLVYLVWFAWTLLGFAVVWTFAAERSVRPAWVSAAIFGALSLAGGLAAARLLLG
jgi:ferredoxin